MFSQKKQEQIMKKLILLLILLFSSCSIRTSFAKQDYQRFLQCLSNYLQHQSGISDIIYTPSSANYTSIYQSSIRNHRNLNNHTRKPFLIITPTNISHVQASVVCAKKLAIPIRVRSGGHDYEGLSYREVNNSLPFIIIDLANLREINVDVQQGTAWVQAGATVGELYYNIANKTNLYGFPAALCTTVGVGGQISGGGFGTLSRKYGLSSDNVVDVLFVDVNGHLLRKDSMGKDLFWAIRGGGGASFGIVVSWKVKLAPVPAVVSVFSTNKYSSQGAIDLAAKWQSRAPWLTKDLFIRIVVQQTFTVGQRQIGVGFNGFFLGSCNGLLQHMRNNFSELEIQKQDCKEMSWIQSILYFAYFNADLPKEVLLDRGSGPEWYSKAKSDFVMVPILKSKLQNLWSHLLENNAGLLIMDPHGGIMDQISETATPYPHRKGYLYSIQYYTSWTGNDTQIFNDRMAWIRNFYKAMTPYVSSNPRAAYVNYRDLDLGMNKIIGNISSYEKGRIWGEQYFGGNFQKLALVKAKVDPTDFFRNEQSIPPLFA